MKIYTLMLPTLLFLGGCAAQQSPVPSPEAIYYQQLSAQKKADDQRAELDKLNAQLDSARAHQLILAKEQTKQLAIQNSGNFTAPQQSVGAVKFPRLEEVVEICNSESAKDEALSDEACDALEKELNDLKRRADVSPPQNGGTSVYIIGSDVSGPLLSAGAVGGRVQTEQVRPASIKRSGTRSPAVQRPKTTGELVAGSINNLVNRSAGIVGKVAPAAIFGWTVSRVAEAPTNYIGGDDNAGRYTDQSSVVTSFAPPEPGVTE